jgi:Kdo2-lipid IVA lauroyltransferase/acyltransferase
VKVSSSHRAEYVALRVIAFLVNLFPYRAALGLGWILAFLAFHLGRARTREALRRIESVFGNRLTAGQRRHVAWISCRNLFFNSVEMLRAPRMTREWTAKVSDCTATVDRLARTVADGRGAITAVPHMGNWELAGITCHLHGLPIFSIAATQKNPLTNEFLNRLRSATGATVLERGAGTMRSVLHNLKAGMLLAILPDVRVRTRGVSVPFLGGVANLGPGMALFARHADVPIVPAVARRLGWTRHVLRTFPTIYPDKSLDKDEDVRRMTSAVMENIEKAIREEPEQWFWFNRRWILDPI